MDFHHTLIAFLVVMPFYGRGGLYFSILERTKGAGAEWLCREIAAVLSPEKDASSVPKFP